MPSKLHANLRDNLPQDVKQNSLLQNLSERLGSFTNQFNNLQALLAALPKALEYKYSGFRKKISSELNNQRKKYRLALESLGWGTLADMLDAAFCGRIIDILA